MGEVGGEAGGDRGAPHRAAPHRAAPWIAGGALIGAAGVMAYAVRGRRSKLLAPSVYKGSGSRRAIALTFDDGPSESTPELLEVLAKHGAKATFFQCGANVRRLAAVAREVASAGHEIGNHSDTHPHLTFKGSRFIFEELRMAQDAIAEHAGMEPVLFRAPYGERWFGLREAQARVGLLGVMWTAIGVDWKWPSHRVASRLARCATNGAIFCLHDGRTIEARPDVRATLRSVRELLPRLIDEGYRFERVSDILCPTI